jgi:Flp pilus assembly secretin CpaC
LVDDKDTLRIKSPEQMMVLKSYPDTATHFTVADTQIAAVGILPKQCKLLTALRQADQPYILNTT